jgi:putative membrane protein
MKRPIARPVQAQEEASAVRAPKAFSPDQTIVSEPVFEPETDSILVAPPARRTTWLGRLAWTAVGILISAGLGLAAERLIRDLYQTNPLLGWLGLVVLFVLILALTALVIREVLALRRLRVLDQLRNDTALASAENDQHGAKIVVDSLLDVYASRSDLARARQSVADHLPHLFDGHEITALAERSLMAPLDARAKTLTAASARRVALVTAVSPRALVDIAFVVYESVRLAGAIAALYGARPGFFGSWRLAGAILAHLAVTGGLVLTDGIVEQLVGQGLAAKVSARLGEGVVNGLMTVRVGIAAMRVVRPMPFQTQSQPSVRDFIPELTKLVGETARRP